MEDFERTCRRPIGLSDTQTTKLIGCNSNKEYGKIIKRSTRWGANKWTKQRHLALARLDSSGRLEYVKKWNNGGGAEAEHPVGTRHKVMTRACNAKSNERRKQKPQTHQKKRNEKQRDLKPKQSTEKAGRESIRRRRAKPRGCIDG